MLTIQATWNGKDANNYPRKFSMYLEDNYTK